MTDNKLRTFLELHLDANIWNALITQYLRDNMCNKKIIFLASILKETSNPSDQILFLIEQFLESLSTVEITEYFNQPDDYGKTIIFYCANTNLMKTIIKYTHNINYFCNDGINILMAALFRPLINLEIVELLLYSDININATNENGVTALMYYCHGYQAIRRSDDEHQQCDDIFESIVELLIYKGADVFAMVHQNSVALHFISTKQPLLSERSLGLLQGTIDINSTKSARKI